MKSKLTLVVVALVAMFLSSCATSSTPGGNANVEVKLFNLQLGGSTGGGYYGSCGSSGRPPMYGGGYQPRPGYQQPRPGYQTPPSGYRPPQPSNYYGHSSNPVMVNGVAFSDQYPGGTRIASPR